MIFESALHAREFEPAKKGGALRTLGPFLVRDFVLVCVACISFIIAKSMTSRADVNIGAIEYWILGLIPLLVLNGYGFVTQRSGQNTLKSVDQISKLFCLAWIISLVLFVIARETHYYEVLRSLVLDDLHVGRRTAEALMSVAVVLPGVFSAFVLSIVLKRTIRHRGWTLFGLFLANALMFELFVYWIG